MKLLLRKVGFSLISLAIIGFFALMAWGLSNKVPVTGLSGITRLQKPPPPFKLTLFDGGEVDLALEQGKPIVINFWASWCIPCREEASVLEQTWRSFRDKDVLFIGVNIQDVDEAARAHINEFGITYPNGLDEGGKITVDYGVIGIPVTFFISKENLVERRWVGEVDRTGLINWINNLVEGTKILGEGDTGETGKVYDLNQRRE